MHFVVDEEVIHPPYYPRDLKMPNYIPNNMSVVRLLSSFFGCLTVCLIGLWFVMRSRRHLKAKFVTKLKISWFFMCGLIHLILEGYFAVYHQTIPGGSSYLAEMWKEYGKADSRYVSGDTFTVCMEAITAFVDGPLAFIATYAFLTNKPYRYVVQLILSLFQLYGDVLYFTTEIKDGFVHGPFGHPLYFWFYFVFLNAFWIVVPFVCIVESYVRLSAAQSAIDAKHDFDNNSKNKRK